MLIVFALEKGILQLKRTSVIVFHSADDLALASRNTLKATKTKDLMDEGVVFAMGDDLATGERTFVATYEEAVIARGTAEEMEEALKPLAGKRGKGLGNEIKQFQIQKELQQIDDAIKELGIEIKIPINKLGTYQSAERIDKIIRRLLSKHPPKHFNPNKKALKQKGIHLPVSKNGTSVDFAGSEYLYRVTGNQKNIVKIKMTGDELNDVKLANHMSGFPKKPKNYTWHHLDDFDPINGTCTMQLVETKVHRYSAPHFGSVKIVEEFHGFKYLNR